MRQSGGGDDRSVADVHAVVNFVAFLEPAQDGDGVFHGRFAHQHFLEAALQRGVLLHVLAVLIEGGGTHAMQFTPRQRGLEHIAGVHRAFGLAGTDHGVQLINEQDDLAFLLGQIVDHGLQPFLELAAELGTGNQRSQVQAQ